MFLRKPARSFLQQQTRTNMSFVNNMTNKVYNSRSEIPPPKVQKVQKSHIVNTLDGTRVEGALERRAQIQSLQTARH